MSQVANFLPDAMTVLQTKLPHEQHAKLKRILLPDPPLSTISLPPVTGKGLGAGSADRGEGAAGESGGRVGGMTEAVGRGISRPWGWHGDNDKTKTVILKPLSQDRQVA